MSWLSAVLVVILLFPIKSIAQDAVSTPTPMPCKTNVTGRPSVGVVLEGGVAVGLAHAGVLEWLQENRIPIDCIAGTSMGALIGALYSMGYTAVASSDSEKKTGARGNDSRVQEPGTIVDFLKQVDWDGVISDRIEYRDLTFMRKQDLRTYPTSLEFRFKGGLRLPSGINPGHRVGLIFDNLAWHYYDVNTFDDLPIPFRAAATDVKTGHSDVLGTDVFFANVGSHGVLSEALRSTMSVPALFYPVILKVHTKSSAGLADKTYVDGGLLQNLPVEIMKDMGADIIITVHLNHGIPSPTADSSITSVVSDTISLVTTATELNGLNTLKGQLGSENNNCLFPPRRCCTRYGNESESIPYHLPITIKVEEFGSLDFEKWKELEKRGHEGAGNSFNEWATNHSGCLTKENGQITRLFDLDLRDPKKLANKAKNSTRKEEIQQKLSYVAISTADAISEEDPAPQGKTVSSLESLVASSLGCKLIPGGLTHYKCTRFVPFETEDATNCPQQRKKKRQQQRVLTAALDSGVQNIVLPEETTPPAPVAEPTSFFDKCNADRLERQLNRMVGTGRFARLGYHIREDGNHQHYVEIIANARETSPVFIKPVIAVDGSDYTEPVFTLGARFTAFDVGPMGSEWRGELLLGSRYGLSTEYYQPIFGATSNWFVAPRITAESSPFNIYHDQDQLARFQMRTISGGLDLGYNFGRSAQLRLGYEGGGVKLSHLLGSEIFPFTADRVGTTSLKFSFDRLEFSQRKLYASSVPRNGVAVNSNFQWHDSWLGATGHFPTATADIGLFKSVFGSGSLFLKADGGSTLGFANNGLPSFSLGGALKLAAYGTNELLTNQYAHGATGYIHRIYQFQALGGALYITGYFEAAKPYGLPGSPTLPKDGTAGLVLDSLVGPLFVGGSVGESGHRKFFFYMGKFF